MPVPSLKDTCRSIEKDLRLKMYTHEHEIVLHLYEFPGSGFADISDRIRASRNTTAMALAMLAERDVLRSFANPRDRRVKLHALAPWAGERLDHGYRAMAAWFRDRGQSPERNAPLLTNMINDLERRLGFPCFSPQYEILSVLFDKPGLSSKSVKSICNSSRSHSQRWLSAFLADGRVRRDMDGRDRRVSAYRLGDQVATALDTHFASSYKWFEARFSGDRPCG